MSKVKASTVLEFTDCVTKTFVKFDYYQDPNYYNSSCEVFIEEIEFQTNSETVAVVAGKDLKPSIHEYYENECIQKLLADGLIHHWGDDYM